MAPSSSASRPDPGARSGGGGGGGGGFSSPDIHRALPLAVVGEKDLGAAFLENLYSLVKKLTSLVSLQEGCVGDAFSVDLSACRTVIYGLIFHLSNWAFEELSGRFEGILSAGKVFTPPEAASGQFCVDQCALSSSSLHDFCLLLKCCMSMVSVLEFDLNLCFEKSQLLVKMLRELCSPDIVLQHRVENDRLITGVEDGSECFPEESSSAIPFFCLILEVFAGKLLVHRNLRKHFTLAYYISSTTEKLPAHDFVSCDFGIIMELVSAHFLLSSREETAFNSLFQLKYSCKMVDTESPKLSLAAALSLLGTPVILSAPYMLQSHMILLVSRCVTADRDLDLTAMNCYVSAFEQSVILYVCYSSRSTLFHDLTGAKCQSRSFVTEHCILEKEVGLTFDSYVRKVTYDAVNLRCQKLVDYCSRQSNIFISRAKEEIITTCMTCIKEKQHVIQEQWREEMCLILNYVIERIARETGKGPLWKNGKIKWQEIYYGAALLDLMASSLLKIVAVLSERGTKALGDYPLCRDYEFISGIIDLLRDHSVGQYVLCDIKAVYSSKQKQTKMMLAHFTSLLFYSIDRGLYLLWDGCIFVMIAVMSLMVFEEGNLDTIKMMCAYVSETHLPACKTSLGMPLQRSSFRIAAEFQKIQLFHTKKTTKHPTYETSRTDVGASQTERRDGSSRISPFISPIDADHEGSSDKINKCNGETFFKCFLEDHSLPDWDDLANFIEATPGKDYSAWLRKRGRYNKWKNEKTAVMRRQSKRILRRKITKCKGKR